ncbi:TonB-dependent receptor [Idiomarina sp. HP20-50]|uniref:TonB-dependent receptor n=1 Tax=Idiomarina sp. HP20-50 TaxID=3070813 RepID=UPI00294B3C58|nr:TonB-dependent receptor [Idiomarina sp. HP20-50]MDV6314831.1 TonB-dependent receptor [Idiomarina sp. HP20-50]
MMAFKRTLVSLVVSGALLGTSQVAAHDGIERILISGHQANLLGQAMSASEGVLGQAEIEIRPMLRTGELMELIPGMSATQHSGSGKANQYFLRGFNLDHGTDFATYVDGMPVNMPTHGHGHGYTDINFLIPELVDQIAYQKGSYYGDVGDFSGAGSVGFSTQMSRKKGLAKVSLGEDAYQRMLLADSISQSSRSSTLYALEYQTYNGPWTDIEEDVNKINGILRHSIRTDGGVLTLGAMGYENEWNSADQIPSRAVNNGLIDELGSIDETLGGKTHRYSVNAIYTAADYALTAYVIDYELSLFSNFTYYLDNPLQGDQFEQVDDRKVYGASGSWHPDNNLTLGFSTRYDDINEVGLYNSQQRERLGAVRSDDVNEWNMGAYASYDYQWTSRLRTNVSLRYDYFNFDVNSLIDTNRYGVDLNANNGETSDELWSFKGSATYLLNNDMEVYLSAGQGFHSNDARGTVASVDPNSGNAVEPVDPLVRTFGYEAGLRWRPNGKLNSSLVFWALEQDSELLFVGDAGNTEASRPSKRQGIELAAYYNVSEQLSFDLEYAYTDAEFDDGNVLEREIPGAMEDILQFGVTQRFENNWFSTVRVRYLGERPLVEDNSVRSQTSTVVNFLLGKQWDAWSMNMQVLNVFDSNDHDIDYFYASRLPGEPVAGVEDVHYHVMEPRTVRFELSYEF